MAVVVVVQDHDRDEALIAHPRLDARDPFVPNIHRTAHPSTHGQIALVQARHLVASAGTSSLQNGHVLVGGAGASLTSSDATT